MRAPAGLGVPNRFKVPKKFWRKLPPIGRHVFNHLFETMRDNQGLFLHSGDKARATRRWRTTCWNAAWIAAGACRPIRSRS